MLLVFWNCYLFLGNGKYNINRIIDRGFVKWGIEFGEFFYEDFSL